MKKIYYSYSDKPEDQDLYRNLNSHLQQYKRKGWIEIYDERELFKLNGDLSKNAEYLRISDITIPLVSIDYLNSEECRSILKIADDEKIKIIPIILRQCDWKTDDILQKYSKEVIPEDDNSVEHLSKSLPDKQTVFKQIGDDIKSFIFPELQSVKIANRSNTFYWLLASMVLLLGVLSAFYLYTQSQNIILTGMSFLMFGLLALLSLRSVLFPTKFSNK